MFGDVTFAQAPFASLGGNTFAVSQSETTNALDLLGTPTVIKGGLQDEFTTGQESASVIATMIAALSESATASEVQSVIATMVATQAELATALDTLTNTANMLVSQSESVTGTDAVSAIGTMLVALAESAVAADAFNGVRVFPVFISETATGADSTNRTYITPAQIAELATGSVTLIPLREANVYPTGIQLIINIGGTLIWVEIDDTQNPNWQNILNSQGVVWTQIPS